MSIALEDSNKTTSFVIENEIDTSPENDESSLHTDLMADIASIHAGPRERGYAVCPTTLWKGSSFECEVYVPSIWVAQQTKLSQKYFTMLINGDGDEVLGIEPFHKEMDEDELLQNLLEGYDTIIWAMRDWAFVGGEKAFFRFPSYIVRIYALFDAYTFALTGSKPTHGQPVPSVFSHDIFQNPYESENEGILRALEINEQLEGDEGEMFCELFDEDYVNPDGSGDDFAWEDLIDLVKEDSKVAEAHELNGI